MNLSMNEAASHLKIGKTRLYQLVNEHKIEPTRRGRRRELSSEQLDNLKSIINFRVPEPEPSTEPPEPSEHFTLIEELKNQNKILLQQLELSLRQITHRLAVGRSLHQPAQCQLLSPG